IARDNDAIEINEPTGLDMHITEEGSNWLWAAFSLFTFVSLIYAALYIKNHFKKDSPKPFLIIAPLLSSLILAYTYFTMASNLGWTDIQAQFNHTTVDNSSVTPGIRQIFYSKWVGYFLAWPTVLYSFELLSYPSIKSFKNVTSLLFELVMTQIFVLSLLISSLIKSSYKWGYFTFGTFSLLLAIFTLAHRLTTIQKQNKNVLCVFSFLALLWILYPVAFGLSEGGNVIEPDSETAFYGVLDVLQFIVVPTILSFI
ncbi:Hsp30p, partial [Ascoidea rubescens DSM 1968]